MNAVGIDVSKGKSMVAIIRPFGEIVASPFEVIHTEAGLNDLIVELQDLNGETKIIMECTGNYHLPIANALNAAGLTVCTVNAQLIHDFGNNTIRKVKTDKVDSIKIANYGITNWLELPVYIPDDEIRHILKVYSRQYNKYCKIRTMLKNNLIALLDQTFPELNEQFTSPPRKTDGHEKWIDFASYFWHCQCISKLSQKVFMERYRKWCRRNKYIYNEAKARSIYAKSLACIHTIPMNETTKLLITQAAFQLNAISETISNILAEMKRLAQALPEYPVVNAFNGVGDILCPQLIAEIGNINKYPKKASLVRYAGLEPVENQSGKYRGNEYISKQGSPHLRRALFQVMICLLQHASPDDPIFLFLDRKRSEGKHYYCYMNAGAAKFLRIYYARVKEYLNMIEIA